MKIIVIKKTNEKTKRTYTAVVYDNGYERKFLSFDKEIVIDMLNITPRELANLPEGEYIIFEKGENN